MDFPDKYAALAFMYANQIGQRNLSSDQYTYCVGQEYEATKMSSEFKGNQYVTKSGVPQNEAKQHDRISKQIADKYGIHRSTVERAAEFAQGIDTIRKEDSNLIKQGRFTLFLILFVFLFRLMIHR